MQNYVDFFCFSKQAKYMIIEPQTWKGGNHKMDGAKKPVAVQSEGGLPGIEYCITCADKSDCQIGDYTVYGIAAKAACGHARSLFTDISADREKVQRFVNLCNIYAVSELHLFDVLYDFLVS